MRQKEAHSNPDLQSLLNLRFTPANFSLLQSFERPENLTPVMQIYTDQLLAIGFVFSHEIVVEQCIGKWPDQPARMLVFQNSAESGYAILTDLYHQKSWVYFTHYFARDRRAITTCQPGALQMKATEQLSSTADFTLQNTSTNSLKPAGIKSQSLNTQWNKHLSFILAKYTAEKALLLDPVQHLNAERAAYQKYTDLLLECVILRQSDTQLVGFTHTGVSSFYSAVTSTSVKRPNPKVEKLVGQSGKFALAEKLNYRNAALAASALVFAVLAYTVATFSSNNPSNNSSGKPPTVAALAIDKPTIDQPTITAAVAPAAIDQNFSNLAPVPSVEEALSIAPDEPAEQKPEQYIIASEEDEMWRIAVENAEFYLMSNDGDPAPWIRTARKMAAGFTSEDPRLARTYFLAAMLEGDPRIAEQQYNRALSIQTKALGLYHTETAQTLEALAWVAEDARDDLEEAITHQKLALNVYRSIFGEEAEDTRAARWKLQYFEDRLEGRRPKSDDNRRLLPALARFAR